MIEIFAVVIAVLVGLCIVAFYVTAGPNDMPPDPEQLARADKRRVDETFRRLRRSAGKIEDNSYLEDD